jgi:phospholipid/cholesterol/gamma-HCH transport system substrate-binding protein
VGTLANHVDTSIQDAQLEQLTTDMRSLLTNVSHLSDQLEREPTRLIFGDRREGYTPK